MDKLCEKCVIAMQFSPHGGCWKIFSEEAIDEMVLLMARDKPCSALCDKCKIVWEKRAITIISIGALIL